MQHIMVGEGEENGRWGKKDILGGKNNWGKLHKKLKEFRGEGGGDRNAQYISLDFHKDRCLNSLKNWRKTFFKIF